MHLTLNWQHSPESLFSNIPKLSATFLSRDIPSFFCAGLRLFDRGLSNFTDKRLQTLFKQGFSEVLEYYPHFIRLFPTSETSSNTWITLLSSATLTKQCSAFLEHCTKIIPAPSTAAFPDIVLCIPQIVQLITGNKAYKDLNVQILQIVDSLLSASTCLLLAKIYIRIATIRALRCPQGQDRPEFLLGVFRTWISRGAAEWDCYMLSDIIFDWCGALLKVLSFDELLPMVIQMLLRQPNRFFSVFAGVMKFVRSRMTNQSPEELEKLHQRLREAAKLVPRRVHAQAIVMLGYRDRSRMALDLARFDDDCDRSDDLLRTCGD
jgi:hypothetical protein